jgi:hypothetical protein
MINFIHHQMIENKKKKKIQRELQINGNVKHDRLNTTSIPRYEHRHSSSAQDKFTDQLTQLIFTYMTSGNKFSRSLL